MNSIVNEIILNSINQSYIIHSTDEQKLLNIENELFNNEEKIELYKFNGNDFAKENVLYIRERLAESNLEQKMKIILISNFDLLSISLQNEFLIHIEEIKDKTSFIFLTKKLGNIINTIKSRMQIYETEIEKKDVLWNYVKDRKIDIKKAGMLINRFHSIESLEIAINNEEYQKYFIFFEKITSDEIDLSNKSEFVVNIIDSIEDYFTFDLFIDLFIGYINSKNKKDIDLLNLLFNYKNTINTNINVKLLITMFFSELYKHYEK